MIVKDSKVLLVKHTYGAAKGKYLIPGGFSEDRVMDRMKRLYLCQYKMYLHQTGLYLQRKRL